MNWLCVSLECVYQDSVHCVYQDSVYKACWDTELSICIPSWLDRDMAARHRARSHSIQIMKVEVIPASKCKRPHITQFHVSLKCRTCTDSCSLGVCWV